MTEIVECYSGHEYAQRPTALWWEGQRLVIEAIESEWRFPGGKQFRVRVVAGHRFELLYAEREGKWRVSPAG